MRNTRTTRRNQARKLRERLRGVPSSQSAVWWVPPSWRPGRHNREAWDCLTDRDDITAHAIGWHAGRLFAHREEMASVAKVPVDGPALFVEKERSPTARTPAPASGTTSGS